MRLTPPTKNVFYASVIVALLGLVFFFVPAVAGYAFWVVLIAYVLLALGNTMKGF
jgi:hypothetical protein